MTPTPSTRGSEKVLPFMGTARLAVVCDYPEEGWPSMDLVAEMLLHQLRTRHADRVQAERVCPPFRRRLGVLPWVGRRDACRNADRLVNRLWDYPRYLRHHAAAFDLFHLCDHSYAQLVHVLPAERTGVYCHDLDTFRCLLEPRRERRPRWFRAMARHILRGLQKAALVFYSTSPLRTQIERHGLVDPARLVHAPYGVATEFTPAPEEAADLPAGVRPPFVLHVGSCIPRKRIDALLDVFARARASFAGLRLVQVGGEWTVAQREQIARLGIGDAVIQLRGLDRPQLAACYRAAAVLLQPSEAEGFGLPIIEGLACGSLVVASDIPVLREVGGPAAVYCATGDVSQWSATVGRLLSDPASAPAPEVRAAQAQRYSWEAQARTIVAAYDRLTAPMAAAGAVLSTVGCPSKPL
jgi:glycosyltransferase involved in cell wall biosynthesis